MKRPRRTPLDVPDTVAAQALLLHRDGTSARAIARALGISRNTVRRLVAGHERRRLEGASALPSPPPPRPSQLDVHADTIAELLRRFPDITAQRVFEELRAQGYKGGYTMVRERVQRARPKSPIISLPTPD
jgi:transposase